MVRATTKATVRKARKLRQSMTLPEILLWKRLRGHAGGVKFRRQHPVGRYVADFYAPAARIIFEIDGIAHDMGQRPEADAERDYWLESEGFRVVRVPAREVLSDVDAVADAMTRMARGASI
jgi:very-short-patch-repair endonuclease